MAAMTTIYSAAAVPVATVLTLAILPVLINTRLREEMGVVMDNHPVGRGLVALPLCNRIRAINYHAVGRFY